MGLQNIVKSERKTVVSFARQFDWKGERNWGFAFECDEQGNIKFDHMGPEGRANYEACLTGNVDGQEVVDCGIRRSEHRYWQPGHGTCVCGEVVILEGDELGLGIDCVCGRIYNGVGQELAPRRQWEENYDDGEGFYDA